MDADIVLFAYGGVAPETVDSLMAEFASIPPDVQVNFTRVSNDALISRSRSTVLSRFLAAGRDVCFMVDHDLSWRPGDLVATCLKAHELGALVAGLYSKRAFGQGVSSASQHLDNFVVGADEVREAVYLAAGFLAIPRRAVLRIVNELGHDKADPDMRVRQALWGAQNEPMYDFFRPVTVKSRIAEGYEYLSEDWAWSERAIVAGVPRFIYALPHLTHHGVFGFTVADGVRVKETT